MHDRFSVVPFGREVTILSSESSKRIYNCLKHYLGEPFVAFEKCETVTYALSSSESVETVCSRVDK